MNTRTDVAYLKTAAATNLRTYKNCHNPKYLWQAINQTRLALALIKTWADIEERMSV